VLCKVAFKVKYNVAIKLLEKTQSFPNEDFCALRAVLSTVATLWPLHNIASIVIHFEYTIDNGIEL